MKTYKQLSTFLNEEHQDIEEGKLATALTIGALVLGTYGGLAAPTAEGPKKITHAAHVEQTPSSQSSPLPSGDKTIPPISTGRVKSSSSGLGKLLSGIADKRRNKLKEKEPKRVATKPKPSHIRSEEDILRPTPIVSKQ
jgi:hypothetical protein